METRASYVLIGAFTLCVFVAAFVFVLWIGKVSLDREWSYYDIVFKEAVTGLTVGGAVQHPKTLTLAELQKEPATTQAVFYVTGRGTVSASFTGVLLWTLLSAADVTDDPAVKNAKLRRTVVVTAVDGYSVALSLGELDPAYGAAQALIAYAQDGKPLGPSGVARLILPADKDGGRNVARIVNIEVR